MYELEQIGKQSYYINCPAKIGIYRRNDKDVYLIDSGNDKEAGKKVLKLAAQNNWEIKAIINTHSNADHIGGNHYLQQQTDCPVFANGIEIAFTNYPILEPSFLYGGYPCKELRTKFLLAKESRAWDIAHNDFPHELEIIPLPGHFFDMAGFRTPDDNVYLADCLSSRETLEKYQIGFIYDVAAYLNTLEKVKTLKARLFVPAHAEAAEDITELAQYNIDKVNEIADKIVNLCKEPLGFEVILQRLFTEYGLVMNFEQYVLVGSTVRSYLAWLKDTGRLNAVFEKNLLLWEKI